MKMLKLNLTLLGVALAGAMSVSAQTTVVNFDDLTSYQPWNYNGNNQGWDTVPATYKGLNWSLWEYADGRDYKGAAFGNTEVSIPSMNNFAYNGSGANTITTSGSKFNFEGMQVAFWAENNQRLNNGASVGSTTLTVNGYNGDILIGTYTTQLTKDFTWLATPGLVGLTSLEFLNDGNPTGASGGSFWVGDDFTFTPVPEPAKMTVMAGAFLLLSFGATTLQGLFKRHTA